MKVQKGIIPDSNRPVWMVLDDNYLPIEPIEKYLHYLDNVGRSPNTIGTYAYNLKLFWEFLRDSKLDWRCLNLEQLSDFIHWLRNPNSPVLSIQAQVSKRSEKTINHCLTTVSGFYEFQERIGATQKIDGDRYQLQIGHKYKSFLHHLNKGKEVKTRLLKIKEPKTFPGCLTPEQVNILIEACNTLRDQFLIRLLYETGLRIGEALGLRHEDMVTGKTNEVHVVPRFDNVNNVRGKSGVERVVHVSKELMQWYSAYLCDEYPNEGLTGRIYQLKGAEELVERLKVSYAELKQQFDEYQQQAQPNTTLTVNHLKVASLEKKRTERLNITEQVKQLLEPLGIQLNSTLTKTIKSVSEPTVLDAIEALKEALTDGNIERPAGWLKQAIEQGWKPNGKINIKSELELFTEWYPKAKNQKLILASQTTENGIMIYTNNEKWVSFSEMLAQHPLETL